MKSKLSIGKLDAIFITHLHGDHFYGLPGLLASKKMDEALKPLTLYGPKGIKKFIDCVLEVSKRDVGYPLTVIEYEEYQEFVFDKFTVKVLPLIHSIESVAFYIQEHDISNKLDELKLREIGLEPSPIYGELKKGKTVTVEGKTLNPKEFMLEPIKGKRVIIAGDNSKPEIMGEHLRDLDLLVHECTYTQEVYENLKVEILHTTSKDLGEAASKFGVKNLIATHISPRYHKDGKFTIKMIEDEIKEAYDGNLFIADDFDVFSLKSEGLKIYDIIDRNKVNS
jgi:ribonuclease Z